MASTDPCLDAESRAIGLIEALAHIREHIQPIAESERVPLMEAHGRVLAQAVSARMDLPPFANSAMDGYAIGEPPGPNCELGPYQLVGSSFAGRPYSGRIGPGECIRVFTGAAVPADGRAVIMQERGTVEGESVRLQETFKPGQNIRPAGDECRAGATLLEPGRTLDAAALGLTAANGMAEVTVIRPLRVAYFSTGDELSPLGSPLVYGQIYDSNRYTLASLLGFPGIEALDLGVVPDDRGRLRRTLLDASQRADAILTTGGVSVGDADYVAGLLAELGQVRFWKIAIKPGKPFAFGRIGKAWLFGLPGNPVAVMVVFRQLVLPGLLRLMGAASRTPLRLKASCLSALRKTPGRMEFQRGFFTRAESGAFSVSGTGAQGSHRLSSVSRANCFIVLPEHCGGVAAGEEVEIEPFEAYW